MAHFTTDMVHYFKDWSIRGTQLTNWQDSLWVTASDPLQKFIPCNTKYLIGTSKLYKWHTYFEELLSLYTTYIKSG